MRTAKTIAIAVSWVLLLPFSGKALAQQMQAQQPSVQQPPASQSQSDLKETELRSFARVYVQIEKILKTYQPQMEEAKTPEEGKQIQNEETSKIHQVLIQEGMDAQRYHHIVEVANADEGLRKKIMGFINEERQKS